jgi:hypothetical protein
LIASFCLDCPVRRQALASLSLHGSRHSQPYLIFPRSLHAKYRIDKCAGPSVSADPSPPELVPRTRKQLEARTAWPADNIALKLVGFQSTFLFGRSSSISPKGLHHATNLAFQDHSPRAENVSSVTRTSGWHLPFIPPLSPKPQLGVLVAVVAPDQCCHNESRRCQLIILLKRDSRLVHIRECSVIVTSPVADSTSAFTSPILTSLASISVPHLRH